MFYLIDKLYLKLCIPYIHFLHNGKIQEISRFFADSGKDKFAVIEHVGYKLQGYFVVPRNDWTVDYFNPIEGLLVEKAKEWEGIPKGLSAIEEARHEIEHYQKYLDSYGYAFFVMRRPEG
jgi:hypothetical protein